MLLSILDTESFSPSLSIRLPQRRNRMIDFETETITYYKISEWLPNVAPKQHSELPRRPSELSAQPADLRTDQEVRIRPLESSQSEIVVEQPNVRQVSALPKLQLPNILLGKHRRWILGASHWSSQLTFSDTSRWMFNNHSRSVPCPRVRRRLCPRGNRRWLFLGSSPRLPSPPVKLCR